MAQKTKRSILPTLVVICILVTAVFLPWPKFLPIFSSNGSQKQFEVGVTFKPEQRSVRAVLHINENHETYPITHSPWAALFSADATTTVVVTAWQNSAGTLSCYIKVNGRTVSNNDSDSTRPVVCSTV